MSDIAERNRRLKKLLEAAFGRGKVSVKGSRGTSYGWVTVNIAYAPRDRAEHDELQKKVWHIVKAGQIEIGTYGYDDLGSDYGYGSKIHINFEQCRDVFNPGERVTFLDRPAIVKERDYRNGGDWYTIAMDNGTLETAYKNDMVRT